MKEVNFLDELLQEAESKEFYQTEAYYDLILLQIKTLQEQIAHNFSEAEKEINLINNWTLTRNSVLNERTQVLERKLEQFIRQRQLKTLELPNGILKLHKKPDKVEIEDMELFLNHAPAEVLTIIPEQAKADLSKIKSFIKRRPVPVGVKVIEGKEEFSYKLRKEVEDGRPEETGTEVEQSSNLRAVV
jgi:hypothetical protein